MCIYREGPPSQLYFAHCVKSPLAIIQMHLAAVKLATLFYGDIPFVFSFGPTELGRALVLNAPWSEEFFLRRSWMFFSGKPASLCAWDISGDRPMHLCSCCWSFLLFKGCEIISWTRLCRKKTMKHASVIKGKSKESRIWSITQDLIVRSGL